MLDAQPSHEMIEAIRASSHLQLLTIPHEEVCHESNTPTAGLEGGAVKRAATKILRRGTLLGATIPGFMSSKSDGLSKEQKEERMLEKLEKEKFLRKEQVQLVDSSAVPFVDLAD